MIKTIDRGQCSAQQEILGNGASELQGQRDPSFGQPRNSTPYCLAVLVRHGGAMNAYSCDCFWRMWVVDISRTHTKACLYAYSCHCFDSDACGFLLTCLGHTHTKRACMYTVLPLLLALAHVGFRHV